MKLDQQPQDNLIKENTQLKSRIESLEKELETFKKS